MRAAGRRDHPGPGAGGRSDRRGHRGPAARRPVAAGLRPGVRHVQRAGSAGLPAVGGRAARRRGCDLEPRDRRRARRPARRPVGADPPHRAGRPQDRTGARGAAAPVPLGPRDPARQPAAAADPRRGHRARPDPVRHRPGHRVVVVCPRLRPAADHTGPVARGAGRAATSALARRAVRGAAGCRRRLPLAAGAEVPARRRAAAWPAAGAPAGGHGAPRRRPRLCRRVLWPTGRMRAARTRTADGRLHEKANVPSADFAAVGTDPALASVRVDAAHTFAFGLAGAAPVTPTVSGNTARYASVLPDTDLVEQAVAIGMKESIVLRSAAAASSWVFPLRLRGLTAALNRDGGVDLVDAGGAVVGTIPHASMQDANVDPHSGEGAGSEAVTYQLTTVDGGPVLRVTADAAWLHDPARVFPVTVDPTANFYATVTDYAQTGNLSDHSGESLIKAGTWDSGTDKATSYLAFSGFATSFAGDKASAVALHIFDVWAYTCTAKPFNVAAVTQSWTTSTVTGFPGPSYGPSIGSATLNPGAACTNTNNDPTVGTWMTVSLPPSTFVDWVSGASPNYGLAVYASYTDSTQWKKFASYNTSNDPYLEVTYSPNVPPQVTGVYPPNNYNATSLTPELLASATDADAFPGAITYPFTIFEASTGTQLATSGAISSSDWVVPAGRLSWAKNYYWTVSTYDGYSYSPTVLSYLNTPVPQPLVTSGLSQSSSGHGFDPSIGDYTTSTTDAQVATVGPELAVHRDYNSRDPRTGGAFGAGWSSLFDARATEVPAGAPQTVVVTYPEGSEVAYGKNADGGYSPPQGRFATFTPVTGGYSLTDKNDTVYRFTQSLGGGAYGITSVTDANGHVETFGYTGSTITTVSSASARALHLTWSTPTGAAWPHVATVATDPVVSGDPASALTWSYSYNADSL